MKKNIFFGTLLVFILLPAISYAQLNGLKSLLTALKDLLNMSFPVLIGLAMAYFFWGMGRFIKSAGEEKAREAGKSQMLWGIVALFVMVSIFGILNWVSETIDIPLNTVNEARLNNIQ